ncbi:unnamed protein product, partial [Rotaria socialis]
TPIININESADNAVLPREGITPSVTIDTRIEELNRSLGESSLDLDPFSGFPSLDSSTERIMSRIETLLENPRGLSFTNDSIIDPPIDTSIPPINVIPEIINIPPINEVPTVINIPAENLSPVRANRSRLPIPIVVDSPPVNRLRRSNLKPAGFYKD